MSGNSRLCPFISKMFFIFHEDCCPNYLVLEQVYEHIMQVLMYILYLTHTFKDQRWNSTISDLNFQFEYLTELELFGGSFYRDKISAFLERRGRGLKRLHLISVASVDYR